VTFLLSVLQISDNWYKKSYIDKLKKVQKRATKMIPELRKMHYPDRLKQLNLPTLTYRRSRGDMIETYKLLTGKYAQYSTGLVARI